MASPCQRSSAKAVLVMGVAGCGKSTISSRLARNLECIPHVMPVFLDADNSHSQQNIDKMSRGHKVQTKAVKASRSCDVDQCVMLASTGAIEYDHAQSVPRMQDIIKLIISNDVDVVNVQVLRSLIGSDCMSCVVRLAGIALTDEDRWPWLQSISAEVINICAHHMRAYCASDDVQSHTSVVVLLACSALKKAYRDALCGRFLEASITPIIVYLKVDEQSLATRLHRPGHFMPVSLLQSQLDTLEEPSPSQELAQVLVLDTSTHNADSIVKIIEQKMFA